MKHALPGLFLFLFAFLFPKFVFSTISLNISNIEKGEVGYSLDTSLSGVSTSSSCYVQVAITAPETPRYFGQTWSPKGEWFKYISSPDKEYIKEYFVKLENDQTIKIIFNTDPEDSDYQGPGEYLVKLKRYTGESSSSAGESNTLQFFFSDPTPTPTPTEVITETPTSTTTPTATQTPVPTPTPTSAPTLTKSPTLNLTPQNSKSGVVSTRSSVLGSATNSASISSSIYINPETSPAPKIDTKKSVNYKLLFFIGFLVSVSSASILYFRYRKG